MLDSVRVAIPPVTVPVTVEAGAWATPSIRNLTVPVTAVAAVTVAVKVTLCPKLEVAVEEVSAAVEAAKP